MAHDGGHITHDLMAGFMHALGGLDHVVMMLAAGLLVVVLHSRRCAMPLLVFPVMLLMGVVLGMTGVSVAYMESAVSISVFVTVLLIIAKVNLTLIQTGLMLGVFALVHGAAHQNQRVRRSGLRRMASCRHHLRRG